ncbi:hypothetical protein AAVH_16051 [Aphelenchoides avenae]|nr:hypothetical protein AAVH_16051 [Aphelenchus avenae]
MGPYYGGYFNCIEWCDKEDAIPCEFDADKDSLMLDFYVELKNKPGCLVSFGVDGCPGWMPIKTNASSLG